MLYDDIQKGIIKPLTRTIFDAGDVTKAFQHMLTGKHTGKLIIKVRENENDVASLPICVRTRFYCNPEFSYILVGGLGGLGLELAHWLTKRKCKKIVFSSSRGVSNGLQAAKIK
jgi:fatty acid synthase, animal type